MRTSYDLGPISPYFDYLGELTDIFLPEPGPVVKPSEQAGCINHKAHERPQATPPVPEALNAAAAFARLRARFEGRRFTKADVPGPVASVALAHRDEVVDGLRLFWSGARGRRPLWRIARVTPDSGEPKGSALEAATDTGFAAWRCSVAGVLTWAAAIPGARMTIRRRGGFRKPVAVYVREPGDITARWRLSKSTPAVEPVHMET